MEHIPLILPIIMYISLFLGLMGITVITIGSIKSAFLYIKQKENYFQQIRLIFSQHLIIGLDFFVGKDIIDTMLIGKGEVFWEELAGLIVVVFIRIILTIMAERELKELNSVMNHSK